MSNTHNIKNQNNDKMRVLSLFSGIGAFEKAIKNLDIDYELLNYCEKDEHASKCYSKIHNESEDKNLWDITKANISHLEGQVDLLVGGSPCQSFSTAGRYQDGSAFRCEDCGNDYNPLLVHYNEREKCPCCNSTNLKGTHSSLIVEYLRAIRETMPKHLVFENVKALVSKKFKEGFNAFVKEIEDYGYVVNYKVLNSKDYGIPQSRERVFVVASLNSGRFTFPEPVELATDISNYVDFREKDNITHVIYNRYKKVHGDIDMNGFVDYVNNLPIRRGIGSKVMDLYNFNELNTISMPCGITGTISCRGSQNNAKKFWVNNSLYKPSPRMCFRLMGFTDEDFDKVENIGRDSQLWDRAGNSVVVHTVQAIFKNLLRDYMK